MKICHLCFYTFIWNHPAATCGRIFSLQLFKSNNMSKSRLKNSKKKEKRRKIIENPQNVYIKTFKPLKIVMMMILMGSTYTDMALFLETRELASVITLCHLYPPHLPQ